MIYSIIDLFSLFKIFSTLIRELVWILPDCYKRPYKKIIVYHLSLEASHWNNSIEMKKYQKQPPRGVPRKRCSENMQQIYRRTLTPKCDLRSKSNFIEIALRHGGSPLNLLHIFRTLFLRTPLGGCFWSMYKFYDLFSNISVKERYTTKRIKAIKAYV